MSVLIKYIEAGILENLYSISADIFQQQDINVPGCVRIELAVFDV